MCPSALNLKWNTIIKGEFYAAGLVAWVSDICLPENILDHNAIAANSPGGFCGLVTKLLENHCLIGRPATQ